MLKLKLYTTGALLSVALLPKALYHTSHYYLDKFETASTKLYELKALSLNQIGLVELKPEKSLDTIIEEAAKRYSLPKHLLMALIKHESVNNPDALSLKSAISYAQVMPANYKRCKLKAASELWDAEKNINCGAQILSENIKNNKGDLEKALFEYNGGPNAYKNRYTESIRHSKEILKNFAQNVLDSHQG